MISITLECGMCSNKPPIEFPLERHDKGEIYQPLEDIKKEIKKAKWILQEGTWDIYCSKKCAL